MPRGSNNPKGEANHNAKLTQKQVSDIRELLAGGETVTEVSYWYNVSRKTIRNARDRKTYT